MALIGRRHFWEEYNFGNTEIIDSGGITDNTLKINYSGDDFFSYTMMLDEARKAIFSAPEIEIVYDLELNVGATSNDLQAWGSFRLINFDPEGSPPMDYGFLVGLFLTAPGNPPSWGILKFTLSGPSFLGSGAANPSGPTRFRVRSDDDSGNVRLQVEVDIGSGFSEVYNSNFGDMAPVIGEIGDNGFAFSAGPAKVIEIGDHAFLDNIQIDEQPVIPP